MNKKNEKTLIKINLLLITKRNIYDAILLS